jgi:hypothetical protein
MTDPKDREFIKLKVGRAVNLVKRIDQWGKQCGSKEQVLRGFYPGSVEPDEDGNEGSLMKGRVKAGEKGPWCHRLGASPKMQLLLTIEKLIPFPAFLNTKILRRLITRTPRSSRARRFGHHGDLLRP